MLSLSNKGILLRYIIQKTFRALILSFIGLFVSCVLLTDNSIQNELRYNVDPLIVQ